MKIIKELLVYCYNLESSHDSDRAALFVLNKHDRICVLFIFSKEFCVVNQRKIDN